MRQSLISRFAKDERGSATIESLLWFMMFVFLLVLITDVSFIFYGKAQALRIVQDGNRALSIRFLQTPAQTEAFIEARLRQYDPGADATTTLNGTTGVIQTVATLNAEELMAVGSIPGFGDFEFTVTAQHFQEQ